MAIQIRDATHRDLLRIVEIEQLAFPTPWTLSAFRRELTLPFSRLTVASGGLPGAQVNGFLCRWLVADECHVLNVAVHPDHRRFGVGASLLRATIAEAREKGAEI